MFHLAIANFAPGSTGALALQDMPFVADPAITLNAAGHIVPQVPVQFIMAYVFGQTDITDAQLTTPKLRNVALPHIRPFDIVTAPSNRPPLFSMRKTPLKLNAIDEISVAISASTGTSGNNYYWYLWFSDGNMAAPTGDIYACQFTASITLTAQKWVNGTITLQNTLPAGTYAVVGLDVWGANLAAARLIFPGGTQWRPGCLAGEVAGYINAPCFRNGEMGQWGTFTQPSPPQLDCFGIGSGSSQTGVMDLIKVG